ncbi:MAG: DUF896 domain-containing protein [Oscillospiraceae bacterium]|nr:DUF896 domain-containing protein [Oscillospiraceae bacterium]
MTDEKVARINALAQKSRTPEGLTQEEKVEQAALRREYVDAVKQSLQGHLDHTTVIRPDGTKHKLAPKD